MNRKILKLKAVALPFLIIISLLYFNIPQHTEVPTTYVFARTPNKFIVENTKSRPHFNFIKTPVPGNTRCQKRCLESQENSKTQGSMYFFVKSAYANIYKRNLLRRTWTSLSILDGYLSRTIFIMGRSPNNSSTPWVNLVKENEVHGDILQADIPDDYGNIPLKTLASMQWASDNLNPNDIYSSVDDDILLNLVEILDSIKDSNALVAAHDWGSFPILCGFVKGVNEKPVRDFDGEYGKYAITKAEYKWHVFPEYCHGGLYTTSVAVVSELYDASRICEILRLDDVWITGILREMIGMPSELVLNKPKNHKDHYFDVENDMTLDYHYGLRKNKPFEEVWKTMFEDIKKSKINYCVC